MTCYVCGTRFSSQSWSAPAEPCDCGFCTTREEWWQMQEDWPEQAAVIAQARAAWVEGTFEAFAQNQEEA